MTNNKSIENMKLTFDAVRDIVHFALFEGTGREPEWRLVKPKTSNWFRANVILGEDVKQALWERGSSKPCALDFEDDVLVRYDGIVNPELTFIWDMISGHKKISLMKKYAD